MLRVALLISGGGSTAEAIIKACQDGILAGKIEPACVIASRIDIPGIERVRQAGIPPQDICPVLPAEKSDPMEFGKEILARCQEREIDLIGQYGWVVKTPPNVIEAYGDKMINQHPGPLDPGQTIPGGGPRDFGGQGMIGRAVIAAQMLYNRMASARLIVIATAQRVAPEYDQGAVLKERVVEYEPRDGIDQVQAKLLPVEHEVQIETLLDFANGTVAEIKRDQPLIPDDKIPFLNLARCHAQWIFRRG